MVKSSIKYYKTMIRDIINFITKEDFNDILVVGDINNNIKSTNIEQFLIINGIYKIH